MIYEYKQILNIKRRIYFHFLLYKLVYFYQERGHQMYSSKLSVLLIATLLHLLATFSHSQVTSTSQVKYNFDPSQTSAHSDSTLFYRSSRQKIFSFRENLKDEFNKKLISSIINPSYGIEASQKQPEKKIQLQKTKPNLEQKNQSVVTNFSLQSKSSPTQNLRLTTRVSNQTTQKKLSTQQVISTPSIGGPILSLNLPIFQNSNVQNQNLKPIGAGFNVQTIKSQKPIQATKQNITLAKQIATQDIKQKKEISQNSKTVVNVNVDINRLEAQKSIIQFDSIRNSPNYFDNKQNLRPQIDNRIDQTSQYSYQQTPQSIVQQLGQRQLNIINTARQQLSLEGLQLQMESIFSRLLQPSQANELIRTGDSFALVKNFQQITESNLSCEQKISYISDFQGRLHSSIAIKNFTLMKLNTINEGIRQDVKLLNQQIQKLSDSLSRIGLDEHRKKVNTGIEQLTSAYNSYNKAESLLPTQTEKISNSSSVIMGYKKKIDDLRKDLPSKKLQMLAINSNISSLEQQLADVKARKSMTEIYLINIQTNINILEKKLREEQKILNTLQIENSFIETTADDAKRKYKILEVDIERQRKQLSQKETKFKQLQTSLDELNNQLSIKNRQLQNNEKAKIQNFIKTIQNVIKSCQQKIDQTNYRCYQVTQIEKLRPDSETLLSVIPPKQFFIYLRAAYPLSQNNILNLQPVKFALRSIGILDSAWVNTLGNPYNLDSISNFENYILNGDFTCLWPSKLQTGQGTITKATKKFIEIDNFDKTQRIKLNLAACTRIQSTQKLPLIGQKIFFRGIKVREGEFNAYKTTCF